MSLGGSSRADHWSHLFLTPLSITVVAGTAFAIDWRRARPYRLLYLIWAACFLLLIAHMLPLPPALWTQLPGREASTAAARLLEGGPGWQPLSIVPARTAEALVALAVPLAVLLLLTSPAAPVAEHQALLVITIGIASGLIGLMAAASDGNAIGGLFANRNHQGVMLACLLPLVAFVASTVRANKAMALRYIWAGVGLIVVALCSVTGSRLGLVCSAVGLIGSRFVYQPVRRSEPAKRTARRNFLLYVGGAIAAGFFVLMAVLLIKSDAFSRLLALDRADELRLRVWGPIAEMIGSFSLFGSGAGTFVEAYQLQEPQALLSPSYLNHAHNEVLEIALTTGVPGILILAASVLLYIAVAVRLWPRPRVGTPEARAAIVVLFILGLASLVDYPLRTPALMCLAVMTSMWLARLAGERGGKQSLASGRNGSPREAH